MFGKGITLFRILGFEVHVDLSWLVLALLITWSLATGFFPHAYGGLSRSLYWQMGVAGALGLFASILFHEFCHSLVARRFGLPMKGITLFIFGGVAEMDDEPPSPRAEFFMAAAGPLSSILLGLAIYAASVGVEQITDAVAIPAILGYLAVINWVLAAFNLIPAFPLDGGRVLRAALWHWKKDLRTATRTASRIGSLFGMVLILFGVVKILLGNIIGGLWQFMIGMFLRSAAEMSYRQVLYRRQLEGTMVASFMNRTPVTVPPSVTVRELVEEYVYRYHFKMFPVVEGSILRGCITTAAVHAIPREEWDRKTVREIMEYCSADNTIPPDTDAMRAFSLMGRTGKSRLMVVDNSRLVGVVTLKDFLGYLSVRMELEDDGTTKEA
jgi:Zn-dependent protease/CBS domain-containing protein